MIVKLHCVCRVVYKHETSWKIEIPYQCDIELGSEVFYEDINVLKIIIKNLIYDRIKDNITDDMKIYGSSEFNVSKMTMTYEVNKEEFDIVYKKMDELLPTKKMDNPAKYVNATPIPTKTENRRSIWY